MSHHDASLFPPPFSHWGLEYDLGTADAIADCNGTVGGHYYRDDCHDCVNDDGHNA